MSLEDILWSSSTLDHLDREDVDRLVKSSRYLANLFKKFRVIPAFDHKVINIRNLPTWKKLFPRLTHCSIRGYDQNILHKYLNSYKKIKLDLSWCAGITDVSALGKVHTLNLYRCINITDVSALGSVHTLYLEGCINITDVSALGSVYDLNLQGCIGITDVSMLGSVHTLNLRRCTSITDVSALTNVHTLNIRGCTGITNTSMLT